VFIDSSFVEEVKVLVAESLEKYIWIATDTR